MHHFLVDYASIQSKVVPRGGGERGLFGGCLPTERSLPRAGGLHQDVGEEAFGGRVPLECLKISFVVGRGFLFFFFFFFGGGVLYHRRFTGGLVHVDILEVHLILWVAVFCCYTGGRRGSLEFSFVERMYLHRGLVSGLIKGSPITSPLALFLHAGIGFPPPPKKKS